MVGNGLQLPILRQGTISLLTSLGHNSVLNVLYVPGLHKNLLSIHSLSHDLNCIVFFDDVGFTIKAKETGTTIMHGSSGQGLYHLDNSKTGMTSNKQASTGTRVTLVIWHRRLGHPAQRHNRFYPAF